MSKPIATKRLLQTGGILALTAVLLYLFFRGADGAAIWEAVSHARLPLILAAIGATMFVYLFRAVRWRILLSPLGRAGLANCFTATVIGFMANALIPSGRAGEIVRPVLLARREGLSASGAFATIFLERILDLAAVTVLIGAQLLVGELPTDDPTAVAGLKTGGALGLAAAVGALSVLHLSARHPGPALKWLGLPLRLLPEKLRTKLQEFMTTFVTGLGVLLEGRLLIAALAWSICVWMAIAAGFWLGARALGVSFAYPHSFLVIGFLTLGVAVPTPGAIGGYHYMGALALTTLFGVDPSVARATALVNHAIAFLPVTFLGIVLFLRAGLSFKSFDEKERD